MTIEQFIDDTVAVTDYLRDRFAQDKIHLLGHSWGSFIALQAAARSPQRYAAYLGMAQVVYQLSPRSSPTTPCLPPTGSAATGHGQQARGRTGHHGRRNTGGLPEGPRRRHAWPGCGHDP